MQILLSKKICSHFNFNFSYFARMIKNAIFADEKVKSYKN